MTLTMEPSTKTFEDVWAVVDPIPGWLTKAEGRLLWKYTAAVEFDGHIVEIGTYKGRSTSLLAETGRWVHAIDPMMDETEDFLVNRYKNVVCRKARSTDFIPGDAPIHFLYIDGDHKAPAPKRDFLHFELHLAADALVAFHDYGKDGGVTLAVNELVEIGKLEFVDQAGSLWVGRATHREAKGAATRVFIFQPCYGGAKTKAFHAAQRGHVHGEGLRATIVRDAKSLLAHDVNERLCDVFRDGGFDYFALVHADLAPEDYWLTKMLRIREERGWDVISAVAAIKNGTGHTSTALAYSENRWDRKRKLTLSEVHSLPKSFDIDDICAAGFEDADGRPPLRLLPNTGCLLLPIDLLQVKRFEGFCIQDAINWKNGDGPAAKCVPEDWNFGHWCAENSVKVGCTSEVVTEHFGECIYSTADVWGLERDEGFFGNAYAAKTVTPHGDV